MEPTQSSTNIQGRPELQIFIKDSRLFINAQNRFHFEINCSGIAQMAKTLFSGAQPIDQASQEANDDLSLDVEFLDTEIAYSTHLSPKKFLFSIDLNKEQVPLDPDISFQRKAEALPKELEKVRLQYQEELANMRREYERKIARLEQMVLQEQEKNVKMQAEYEAKLLRASRERPPVPTFDQFAPRQIRFRRDMPSPAYFEFSDNDKTVRLLDSKETRTLRCYPKVPGTGKHTFSLKVNQIGRCICFGITTKEEGEVYEGDRASYVYFIKDGRFLHATKSLNKTNKIMGAGDKGSVVDMMVDMNARDLVFYVDGRQVRWCKLNMEKKEYIVFVSLLSIGDSVTLLYCM